MACIGIEKAPVSMPRHVSSYVVWEGPRHAFVSTRRVQDASQSPAWGLCSRRLARQEWRDPMEDGGWVSCLDQGLG